MLTANRDWCSNKKCKIIKMRVEKNSYLLLIKLKKIIALKQSNKKKHNTQQQDDKLNQD